MRFILTFLLLCLCGLAVRADNVSNGSAGGITSVALAPGFTTTPGTQNLGTQTITTTGTLNGQLWPVLITTSCTIDTNCQGTAGIDGGALLIANGAGITFTLPASAAATKGRTYQLGSLGGNSYTVTVSGGAQVIAGCTGGGSNTLSVGANVDAIFEDMGSTAGTSYKCTLAGAGATPSLTVTDGTHNVAGVASLTLNNGVVSGASPNATWGPTITDPAAKTASYTVVATDMGNAINLGGAGGFSLTLPAVSSTIFPQGSTLNVMVSAASSWLITNSTGLTLVGIGTTLCPGDFGTFVPNADGAHLDFFGKSCSSAQVFGEAHGTTEVVSLTSNDYAATQSDCGKIKELPGGTTPTVHLPNITPPGNQCTITFITTVAVSYQALATGSGTTQNSQNFSHSRGINPGDHIIAVLIIGSTTAAKWDISGDLTS